MPSCEPCNLLLCQVRGDLRFRRTNVAVIVHVTHAVVLFLLRLAFSFSSSFVLD